MKHGNKKIAGIVLAAGTSTRMGRSKQLLKIRGKTLAERVLSEALFSDLEKVVLVLGHDSERIRKGLEGISQDRKLVITVNPLYSDGMSTSLIAGLREVEDEYSRIMVLLGDMPFVRSHHINLLISSFLKSDRPLAALSPGGRRSHPVIFDRSLYPDLYALRGDVGARSLFEKYHNEALLVEPGAGFDDRDLDTPEEWENINLDSPVKGLL